MQYLLGFFCKNLWDGLPTKNFCNKGGETGSDGIAQFGPLTLIQKAYSAIVYLAIPVILIPYIIQWKVLVIDGTIENKVNTKERAIP